MGWEAITMNGQTIHIRILLSVALLASTASCARSQPEVVIRVDAEAGRHAIDPRIYGTAYATPEQLKLLNCPLNRLGGNNTSRYNWRLNADNRANDWYFESIGDQSAQPGERGDSFIAHSREAGAEPMVTIPMVGWVAKLGPGRGKLASFSVRKYGPQQKTDPYMPDAGNGNTPDGKPITGNDPNDADVPADVAFQRGWVQHLVHRWGAARKGGLRYYLLDNEPSIWHSTHRDVHPVGAKMEEIRDKMVAYASMIKAVDPSALVVGPEEWGWTGYILSGYDQQWGSEHHWQGTPPDKAAHGGQEYLPWLLDEIHKASGKRRLLDVFTVHYYPQGGEGGNDVTPAIQLKRNRSTRSLWDPNYVDESWIHDKVRLIPRLKEWVAHHFPGTLIGITEYNWGAEDHINGATAQADILGIFGREGLDVACRWTTPDIKTPTFKSMQIYRNYDGRDSGFGETSVYASVPDPDSLSAFAALRKADGALTLMVINKALNGPAAVRIELSGFRASGPAQSWQLTAANRIDHLADVRPTGSHLFTTVPAQSITLFVIPGRGVRRQFTTKYLSQNAVVQRRD